VPLIDPTDIELETIRALGDFAGRRVIEIGAGDGRLSWPLAPQAALWLAVEPDGDELSALAADQRERPLGSLRLLQGDGQAQALGSGTFDTAFFTWSLCCVPAAGMAAALAEAGRVLRPEGLLLDVHPTADPPRLEAWVALSPRTPRHQPEPGDYQRVPLGALATSDTLAEFMAASAAVEGVGPAFERLRAVTFEYRFFFESLNELTDYLEDNDELDLASDDLLEGALLTLSAATTPAWLVLIQTVSATSLRKR
jgi:SAM-dependent methyltransferase